ncbi:MAG: SRPBCC family protein [Halobacteriaceae archaeon]
MTVRVERVVDVESPVEEVWEFISDPERRVEPISVVDRFERTDDGEVWFVRLPIPLVNRTIRVETRDVERDPPRYVKFVGHSSAFRVTGEHELEAANGGTRLTNRFVVEGRVPGVERFFRRQFDEELDNLERAVQGA